MYDLNLLSKEVRHPVTQFSDLTDAEFESLHMGGYKKSPTMDKWAKWLESVLDDALEREKGSGRQMSEVAHKFLLNWSLYGYVLLL